MLWSFSGGEEVESQKGLIYYYWTNNKLEIKIKDFYAKNTFKGIQGEFSIDKNFVTGITNYGQKFASFIEKNNIFGSQFHPEKSHKNGLTLLSNFLKLKW